MGRLSLSSIGSVIAGACLVAACGDSTGTGSGGGSTTGSTTGTGGDATTSSSTASTATTSAGGSGGGTAGVGGGVPTGWTCSASFYDTGNSSDCDCGCGIQDPDCADLLVATCDYCADTGSCSEQGGSCPSFIDPTNNATCSAPTLENNASTCADNFDNDHDGEPDCDDSSCFGQTGCAPASWTCPEFYWDDSVCDCGCGAQDMDCADGLVATCDLCDLFGSCSDASAGCPGFINPTSNGTCTAGVAETGATLCADSLDNDHDGEVDCDDSDCLGQTACPPVGWTCPPDRYDDSGCDCGCGIADPDCTDATAGSCDSCALPGSCSPFGCPGNINATNNAFCQ